jgi:hypothetical protein
MQSMQNMRNQSGDREYAIKLIGYINKMPQVSLNGVQGAAGSNPVVPTSNFNNLGLSLERPFVTEKRYLFPIHSPLTL